MNNNKNIDRLFQEKFKDFDVRPSDTAWEAIAEKLNHPKKKRRVLTLWWQLGGIAAGLILLFSIGNLIFNSEISTPIENNSIVNTDDTKDTSAPENNGTITSKISEDNQINTTNTVSKDESNEIATTNNSNKNQEENIANSKENKTIIPQSSKILQNTTIVKNNSTTTDESSHFNPINTDKNSITTVIKNSKDSLSKNENALVDTKIAKHINEEKKNIKISSEKKETITDITEEKETDKLSITESIAIAKNLEDALNLKKGIEDSKTFKKWQITPNVAPVFFNTIGNSGSTIGNQFNDNSKTGGTNISYGINAKYAISKRLKIRAGVNKVDLGFSTNDVLLFNSQIASSSGGFSSFRTNNISTSLRNINLNNSFSGTSVVNANEFAAVIAPGSSETTSIGQQFGFIEVPLELEYAVLDKKFGLRFIGGFSALFLNNNDVFSTINGQSTLIGEATNINNTSYSANFGLGINYGVSKTLNFNIEPTFKYQLNTFSNVSGDFQPYFIGIYSGFTFKF